ncbi:hypothetical protein IQ255_21975 [Pleurocapsales cyanobacterium LEGE 10410]|nr:hypothetical protein [Pleurocapsales cyanobacterium LEGE 10410]
MSNLPNDHRNNLVSFLRQNKPIPPLARPNLEQRIIDSLEPRVKKKRYLNTWTIPSAIATGFLFTSVNFGLRTPRVAIEPKDLENFLVKNWQNTLDNYNYAVVEETEAHWLLPTVAQPQPTMSVSAQ